MPRPEFIIYRGEGPLVACAIHDGHSARPEAASLFAIDEPSRLREEDPFTGRWAQVAPTRIVGLRSRFEVDLNRPRDKAVYIRPEDAWGLGVWKTEPSSDFVARSLEAYDAFYSEVGKIFAELKHRYGMFVVYDLHTYNHRREGPNAPPADPRENPEVNLGTGTMKGALWRPIVDRFMADLRSFDFMGRHLDVRENIKFQGGRLSQWTHENFPETGCVLAIEFKKFFMDEWTGEADNGQLEAIFQALRSTVPGVWKELKSLGCREE